MSFKWLSCIVSLTTNTLEINEKKLPLTGIQSQGNRKIGRNRQTDKQTDGQTGRQANGQTDKQTNLPQTRIQSL